MKRSPYYQYFVEGDDEEKIVNMLKTEMRVIYPGKVQKFNVVQEKLTRLRLMSLKKGTTVILVFDTDTGNLSVLKENIEFLKKENAVNEVLCITQVKNLEDELKRSCAIHQIKELTGSRSNSDFKRDLLKESRLAQKLEKHKFDFEKFWNTNDSGAYRNIKNEAYKIKIDQQSKR